MDGISSRLMRVLRVGQAVLHWMLFAPNSKEVRAMDNSQKSFAQRSRVKLYFDHSDMDYYLSWVIGRQIYQGSDPTACLEVAARIVDGSIESWQQEWLPLARSEEEKARSAFDRGDHVSARESYLKACTYYRAPMFLTMPRDPAFDQLQKRMQSCFQQAATLFDPPIEPIRVPYQGHLLPGYRWTVDRSGARRPTLIVFGGIETFAEDCYFMIGSAGPEHGYNVITVDLPGQGMTPNEGLFFGAKMETPAKSVLDYALSRPDVDPERLAVFGFSWGGHIVFKAAQHDTRIKAMIANPPMPDVFRAALAQQQGQKRKDPVTRMVFEQIAWRMGLKISANPLDIARRLGKAYDYLTHGKADARRISCPVFLLAGAGEPDITLRIAGECLEQLQHPKKQLRIFTQEENGEAHCQVNNLALPNETLFAWLNDVFG